MSEWTTLKQDDKFYGEKYWQWQSTNAILGGKIQAEVLFQDYIKLTDKVLDFGCGSGTTLKHINCQEKMGFEINPYAVKFSNEQSKVKTVSVLDDIPNNYFDVIITNHALEHTPTPYEDLLKLQKKLVSNGRIVIYVPSMQDELMNLKKGYNYDDNDNHLFNWNHQLLANLLIKCGFKILDAQTKPYSRTGKSDNAYRTGGKEKFIKVASRENRHPQTFVYATL